MNAGHTLGEAVEAAEQGFLQAGLSFGHGSASAYDEAAYLVLHTLHLPLYDLESVWKKQLTEAQQSAVASVIHRRIGERIPAAYLTGEAWLGPHRFYIDSRALVPRSFIAELLEEDLSPWVADPHAIGSVLDLCTGSGCLAIIAALTFPNANIDAADLSADALAVAQRNVDDYAMNGRVRLVESDMFAALAAKKYDLIVCNPPYVTASSMAALPQEYRHEPEMALASGNDGLDHIRTLLSEAPKHLHQGGLLVVEAGFNRAGVEAAFPAMPFIWAEVSAGDDIVFMLTREELLSAGMRSPG